MCLSEIQICHKVSTLHFSKKKVLKLFEKKVFIVITLKYFKRFTDFLFSVCKRDISCKN